MEGGGQGLAKNSVYEIDRPRIPVTLVLQERTQPIETTLRDPSSTAPGTLPGGSVPLPIQTVKQSWLLKLRSPHPNAVAPTLRLAV
jgi:hypothetical protein